MNNIIMHLSKIIYPCSPYVESTGFTRLMYLVINTRTNPQYLEDIKNILDNNILELDKQNDEGWTAIMLAVRNYNTRSTPDTVSLLLYYNPDMFLTNNNDDTVFDLCICNYNHAYFFIIFKLLLDKVDLNKKNNCGDTVFMKIIKKSLLLDDKFVRFFLDNYAEKIDFNITNKSNKTVYDIAVEWKLYNISRIISEYYYSLEKYPDIYL